MLLCVSFEKLFMIIEDSVRMRQDLRNHGSSPHSKQHDYNAMSLDVLHFCEEHSLRNIALLGHSMWAFEFHVYFFLTTEIGEERR